MKDEDGITNSADEEVKGEEGEKRQGRRRMGEGSSCLWERRRAACWESAVRLEARIRRGERYRYRLLALGSPRRHG